MYAKWKNVPAWAQWLARDADGSEWWFENEPVLHDSGDWILGPYRGRFEEAHPVQVGSPIKEPRPT